MLGGSDTHVQIFGSVRTHTTPTVVAGAYGPPKVAPQDLLNN